MSNNLFRYALALPTVLLLVAASVSCGGGSKNNGGGVVVGAPADISGMWAITTNNAGTATYTNCSGDFTVLNGLTVAAVAAASDPCTSRNPFFVTQVVNDYTIAPQAFTCVTSAPFSRAGGGLVTENTFAGQIQAISGDGWINTTPHSGVVLNSTTVSISESRVDVTGSLVGGCNMSPPLSSTGQIVASVAASGLSQPDLLTSTVSYVLKARDD